MRRKRIWFHGMLYYRAGTDHGGYVSWSGRVSADVRSAVLEARRMASEHGGRPMIEWWPRSRGASPGPGGAEGALYVDGDIRPE
jgi:hypothetical protein